MYANKKRKWKFSSGEFSLSVIDARHIFAQVSFFPFFPGTPCTESDRFWFDVDGLPKIESFLGHYTCWHAPLSLLVVINSEQQQLRLIYFTRCSHLRTFCSSSFSLISTASIFFTILSRNPCSEASSASQIFLLFILLPKWKKPQLCPSCSASLTSIKVLQPLNPNSADKRLRQWQNTL